MRPALIWDGFHWSIVIVQAAPNTHVDIRQTDLDHNDAFLICFVSFVIVFFTNSSSRSRGL